MRKIIRLIIITLVSIMLFQSCINASTYKKGQVWIHYENDNPFDSTLWLVLEIKESSSSRFIHYEDITNGGDTTIKMGDFWIETDHLLSDSFNLKKSFKLKKETNKSETILHNNENKIKNIEKNNKQSLLEEYPDLKNIIIDYKNTNNIDNHNNINTKDLLKWISVNYYLTKK